MKDWYLQKRLFISKNELYQECGSRLCRGDDSLFDSLTPASSCSPVNLDLDLEKLQLQERTVYLFTISRLYYTQRVFIANLDLKV